jgi:DNA-binding MarR family transcriptional regulator
MDFFDTLIRYETDLWNHLDRTLLADGAVSLATLEALRVVERHAGRARVHELQDDLRLTVGAASKLADRLEKAGLAVRSANPDDRRSSILSLTSEGRAEHAHGVEVLDKALTTHLADDDGEIEGLTISIQRLSGRLTTEAVR